MWGRQIQICTQILRRGYVSRDIAHFRESDLTRVQLNRFFTTAADLKTTHVRWLYSLRSMSFRLAGCANSCSVPVKISLIFEILADLSIQYCIDRNGMPWRVHLCTWRPHSTSVIYTALSNSIFVHALFLWGQVFLSNGSPMSPCRTQHADFVAI